MTDKLTAPKAPEIIQDKAETKTVSLPASLWRAIDQRVAAGDDGDRSGYFRRLVRADLRDAGLLPGTRSAVLEAAERLEQLVGQPEAERLIAAALSEVAAATAEATPAEAA